MTSLRVVRYPPEASTSVNTGRPERIYGSERRVRDHRADQSPTWRPYVQVDSVTRVSRAERVALSANGGESQSLYLACSRCIRVPTPLVADSDYGA
jgi:hypothetical protein